MKKQEKNRQEEQISEERINDSAKSRDGRRQKHISVKMKINQNPDAFNLAMANQHLLSHYKISRSESTKRNSE
jgi:hypothetical protein